LRFKKAEKQILDFEDFIRNNIIRVSLKTPLTLLFWRRGRG